MSIFNNSVNGQGMERYKDKIFPKVRLSKNIRYAQNTNLHGKMQDLHLDVYQPEGDTLENRPLIIFLHGGAFMHGTRTDSYMVAFCHEFARRGYVTVSMSYRLGVKDYFSPVAYGEAVYRATQDAKAAVRFFRANAADYKIDPSMIFIGGGSAGAIAAVQAAYCKQELVPSYLDINKLGRLDDAGGNTGYSSNVQGVINCWGAIIDTSWITAGSAPIVSVHGEDDEVVPFKSATMGQFSLFGSYYIHRKAEAEGIKSKLHAFANTGHGLTWGDKAKWDTTLMTINNFLYDLVKQEDVMQTGIRDFQEQYRKAKIYQDHSAKQISGTGGSEIKTKAFLPISANVRKAGSK